MYEVKEKYAETEIKKEKQGGQFRQIWTDQMNNWEELLEQDVDQTNKRRSGRLIEHYIGKDYGIRQIQLIKWNFLT